MVKLPNNRENTVLFLSNNSGINVLKSRHRDSTYHKCRRVQGVTSSGGIENATRERRWQ